MVKLPAVKGRPHALNRDEARMVAKGRIVVATKNTDKTTVIGTRHRPRQMGAGRWLRVVVVV
jgi:hypothetical protein